MYLGKTRVAKELNTVEVKFLAASKSQHRQYQIYLTRSHNPRGDGGSWDFEVPSCGVLRGTLGDH